MCGPVCGRGKCPGNYGGTESGLYVKSDGVLPAGRMSFRLAGQDIELWSLYMVLRCLPLPWLQ